MVRVAVGFRVAIYFNDFRRRHLGCAGMQSLNDYINLIIIEFTCETRYQKFKGREYRNECHQSSNNSAFTVKNWHLLVSPYQILPSFFQRIMLSRISVISFTLFLQHMSY